MSTEILVIEQRISTGGQFDGTEPNQGSADSAGVRIYAPHSAGGLFKFFADLPARPMARKRYLKIMKVELDMDNLDPTDEWIIQLVSTNGTVEWYKNGTGNFMWTPDSGRGVPIAPDQELKITTGKVSLGELFARITADPDERKWTTPLQ